MAWTNVIKVLEDMGIEAVDMFRTKLDQPDPFSSNATRTLYNSTSYKVVADGKAINLVMTFPEEYVDKSTGKLFLEQGRLPGKKPPISVIKKWVIDRSIAANPYAIQYGIERKGIRPKPYVQEIRRDILIGQNIGRLEQAIIDDIKELLKI